MTLQPILAPVKGAPDFILSINPQYPKPNKSEPKRSKRKSITIDSADKAIGRISF